MPARASVADHALGKPGAWADQPWEGDHVAKVHAARSSRSSARRRSASRPAPPATRPTSGWRRYPDDASVMAYIGRSGWNTLAVGGSIPDDEILEAVDESYRLVVSRLPKKHRPPGWEQ